MQNPRIALFIVAMSALPVVAAEPSVPEPGLDGFQFTAGLGVIHTGKKESVVSTTVDNGVLRVTERQKVQNGLWLASHMFTDSCLDMDETSKTCKQHKKSRFGAFVAAQIGGSAEGGDSKLVQAIAIGASYTYMTRLSNTSGSAPLVFSVGVASVPVRTLAQSYEDNKPLPSGSNQPVIVTKNVFAPLVMVSYRFGGL
jgi:hypothetical protein